MSKDSYRLDGKKIVSLRSKRGWGRDKLLDRIKASGDTLSRDTLIDIEKEHRKDGRPTIVSGDTRGTLATAFGVEATELDLREDSADTEPLAPSGLKDCLCSFDAFVKERTEDFVGRTFVFNALADFQSSCASGYFLIYGEPGIGKSAFIARLVETQRCPHHFNIGLQGINTARIFLRNICAQLITRYRLPYESLPDDAAESGRFFNNVLSEVKQTLKENERLVIAIDALDEVNPANHPANENVLFLPPSLPDGVFVVATTRPLHTHQLRVSRSTSLELGKNSKGQIADVHEYIESWLKNERIRALIAAECLDNNGFIDLMLQKSERNFMYLHYVLPALVEKATLSSHNVKELPQGLRDFYSEHWKQMQKGDPSLFHQVSGPVVCLLGAVTESVSAEFLTEVTGLKHEQIEPVLQMWHEFLQIEQGPNRERYYRLYHASFREFLQDEVDPGLKKYKKMIGDAGKRHLGIL